MGDFVELEITCADTGGLLGKIADKGIVLQDLHCTDVLTIHAKCSRTDAGSVTEIVKKSGGKTKIKGMKGASVFFMKIRSRPVIVLGLLLLIIMTLFLPTRILFIRVDGNSTVPINKILEEAENCGIYFGASRRQVRSEQVKNALIGAVPQLQWIGINTSGCVATISVREKSVEEETESFPGVGSIVAARDGVVTACTVTNGTPLCKVGEAVTQGQILVSGYTDCGIAIKSVRAEGEVSAYTLRDFSAVSLNSPLLRGATAHTKTKYSLLIGKKLINFFKGSGISDTSCVKMYSEDFLTLPGGFQLPVALVTQTEVYYSMDSGSSSESQWIPAYGRQYLLEHMQAGKILGENMQMHPDDSVTYFYGQYICQEMIGQFIEEEIVHEYGQTD